MITVIDYGAGNLASVRNALGEVGVEHTVVNTPEAVRAATDIILPGVGHFGQMMNALDSLQLRKPLLERIREGIPYLGICLGMQALFESSEEAPGVAGLGLLPGTVRRFPADARVPHMGWNQPAVVCAGPPRSGDYRYFAHSYYCPVHPHVVCETCDYGGVTFMASLQSATMQGVQFHPEKSGAAGLALLKGFAAC